MLEEEKTKVGGSYPLDVVVEANDLSIAGGRDQGEQRAQEEDERRGGNGRQPDRRSAGHGESVPGTRRPAQREFGKAPGRSKCCSEGDQPSPGQPVHHHGRVFGALDPSREHGGQSLQVRAQEKAS